jgi:tetratricopeptide (TPR) repeat protein
MPKKRSLVSAGLVCLWMGISIACPATAEEPDMNAIWQLLESGNDAAALVQAQKLEATAKAQFGINHVSYAYALNLLATVYQAQEKYEEAEALYRRAMAIREKVLGDDHPVVANSLALLSSLYRLQRKFAEAEGLLRHALEIQTRTLGNSDSIVGATLIALASACLAQGKGEEADALHERGISIFRNAIGRLLESGNHAAALMEAEKLEEVAEAVFGINHVGYAHALNVLAAVYMGQDPPEKFDEAEALYRRAMTIREEVLGDDHPDVAQSLTLLSALYSMQRKFAEAEGLLRRALEIQTRALGDRDFSVGTTLVVLASACLFQDKREEADALRERGISIINNAMNAVGRK